ncbi:DUF423 domain-containing protein [Rhizobium lemnae]|uniref:DUF423 domain-containing protein n=1 Tax=Rhizobium lemnae TaxID=1214924 RepID=A0ABV8E877_9HYPH|nr:DUF423 domain-containing protein [Rhizobium lemnae]MCJ8509798.1 DUF423 domain-containing protein [Rhizobium lemnae]
MLARTRPLILMLCGFLGASGVMLAAAASHGEDARLLGSASTMCLAHAPVLLGLWIAGARLKTAQLSALVLAIGTILFAGDLLSRHFGHGALFPMAAPTGGLGMIAGWLLIAIGAFYKETS